MKIDRLVVHVLLLSMGALVFLQLLETPSDATTAVHGFRSELLLNPVATPPALDRIARLEKNVITSYVVGPNEDVWSICHRYGIDQFTIRSSNDLDESPSPGTVLHIPNHKGTLFELKTPQSLHELTSGFEAGRKGGSDYDFQVLAMNDFPLPDLQVPDHAFKAGTVLFLPSAYKPTGLPIPFKDMHFRITSGFGLRHHPVLGITRAHKGMDIAKPYGSAVYPSRTGVITYAGWMGGYGNMIEIRHVLRNGKIRYTRYGHLSAILVHVGQTVGINRMIGRVGSTGISTGPHLHFEVRDEEGQARNPARSL